MPAPDACDVVCCLSSYIRKMKLTQKQMTQICLQARFPGVSSLLGASVAAAPSLKINAQEARKRTKAVEDLCIIGNHDLGKENHGPITFTV